MKKFSKIILYFIAGILSLSVLVALFDKKEEEKEPSHKEEKENIEQKVSFSPSKVPYWLDYEVFDSRENSTRLVFQMHLPLFDEPMSLEVRLEEMGKKKDSEKYYLNSITGAYIRFLAPDSSKALVLMRTPNSEILHAGVTSINNTYAETYTVVNAKTKFDIKHTFPSALPEGVKEGLYSTGNKTPDWGKVELNSLGMVIDDTFFHLVGTNVTPKEPFYSSLYFDSGLDYFYELSIESLSLSRWVYDYEAGRFYRDSSRKLEFKN